MPSQLHQLMKGPDGMNGPDPPPKRALDIRAALLDEYLELKEKLGPLEKRLEDVRDGYATWLPKKATSSMRYAA